jgi:hypothetical protein
MWLELSALFFFSILSSVWLLSKSNMYCILPLGVQRGDFSNSSKLADKPLNHRLECGGQQSYVGGRVAFVCHIIGTPFPSLLFHPAIDLKRIAAKFTERPQSIVQNWLLGLRKC